MGKTSTGLDMLREIWHRVRGSSTREELILFLGLAVPWFALAWTWFRYAHHLPMVVDMLFPLFFMASLHIIANLMRRRLGIEKRSFWPEDEEDRHWRNSRFNQRGFELAVFCICFGWWIGIDHTNRFPENLGFGLFLLGPVLIVCIPVLNAAYFLIKARIVR